MNTPLSTTPLTPVRYRLVVAYDGTDYAGWQRQQHCLAVTQVLEDAFRKTFNHNITIIGASRTDAGVHAAGQVALATTDLVVEPQAMLRAWNNVLPPAVLIRSLTVADDSFHPWRNVVQKTYYYQVFLERPLPFLARYGWYRRAPLDREKLQAAVAVFVGTHDFRSFCTLEEEKNTVRTIDSITIEYVKRYRMIRIAVRGQSFLHYMIRRIVGACVTVATRPDLDIPVLQHALAQKDPRQILPKAPAHGLLLYKVQYQRSKE